MSRSSFEAGITRLFGGGIFRQKRESSPIIISHTDLPAIATREVDRNKPEIIAVTVRSNFGEIDTAASDRYRARMLDKARTLVQHMRMFDAASYPDFGHALDLAAQAARDHISAKLQRLGLPQRELALPYFVTEDPEPEGLVPIRGYVSSETGLTITIVNDSQSELKLQTAHNVAHETSHESVGLEVIESIPAKQRVGHERWETGKRIEAEGGMLENASANIDGAEVYAVLKSIPYFHEAVREREQEVASATRRKVRYNRRHSNDTGLVDRIVSMKRLGMPLTFIESILEHTGNGNIDQFVAMWKLMRILGKNIVQREGRKVRPDEYFAIGRDFMEKSRYTGSDDARERIREIFGEEGADFILKAHHSPQNDSHNPELSNVLHVLKVTEERMGLAVNMHSKLGDFELY